ncbi:hypothetical protein D3C87_75530 [compost metagenome]
MNNKVNEFVKTQADVSMATPPTLLMDIAFKLGISKPGADKERLVKRVNNKLAEVRLANERAKEFEEKLGRVSF